MKILDRLFHIHKYTILKESPLCDYTHNIRGYGFILLCEECGKINYKRIKF